MKLKKHTALKQNIKNDTCIEFRRDIIALTLSADITSVWMPYNPALEF